MVRIAFAFALLCTMANAQVSTDSLLSFWAFNEGSGTAVHDSSGHKRTATIHGATWVTGGVSGSAINLNTSASYAQADSNAPYSNFTSALTISLWFNPSQKAASTGTGPGSAIINKWVSGKEDKGIKFDTNGAINFWLYGANGGGPSPKSHYKLPLNKWTNITATYNGTVADIYVNGVLDTSAAFSGLIGNNTGNLYVGANPDRNVWPSAIGYVDNVRFYKRALSASEALALYNNDFSPGIPVLSLPANGTQNEPVNATLSWATSSGATGYRVQLSNTSTFSMVNDTSVATTSRIISSLSLNNPYYWRVCATNAIGNSSWSSIWSFKTVATAVLPGKAAHKAFAAKSPSTIIQPFSILIRNNKGFSYSLDGRLTEIRLKR